jgi:hypothetical protein
MTAFIVSNVLGDVSKYFDALPEVAEQAAVLAINETVEREGLALLRGDMRKEINFPSGYLERSDRMKVGRKAGKGSLEATIRARDRATSLARFAPGQTPENTRGRGVRVTVAAGTTQVLRNAFLMRLRNGNMGLAIRLKDNEQPTNTTGAKNILGNLWLLYGPSVDQVFAGVAEDKAADISNMITKKFFRQFARLSSG